jgi:hypothetical protein
VRFTKSGVVVLAWALVPRRFKLIAAGVVAAWLLVAIGAFAASRRCWTGWRSGPSPASCRSARDLVHSITCVRPSIVTLTAATSEPWTHDSKASSTAVVSAFDTTAGTTTTHSPTLGFDPRLEVGQSCCDAGCVMLDSLPQSVARRPCSSPMGTPLPRDACGVCQNSTPHGGGPHEPKGEAGMAERRYGGITLGGIIVIVGIVVMFVWSFWIGLIIALIGLIAFGGFARGKWY